MNKRRFAQFVLAGAACVLPVARFAAAQTGPYDLPPGYSQRQVHDPLPRQYDNTSNNANTQHSHHGGHPHGNWGNNGTSFFYGQTGLGWGGIGYGGGLPVGYLPWYSRYYYPPPYSAYPVPYYIPPLVIPAESIYGPAAASPMITSALPQYNPTNIIAFRESASQPVAPNPPVTKRAVRTTNDNVRARARRSAESGDEEFLAQKYGVALVRYRRAIEIAPDVAEWHFREGQTLIALGRYADACKVIRRGLEIDPKMPQWPMRLDTLYGPNHLAKAAQFEALAQAATKAPRDANLLFLLGVELFLDGQAARSQKFFDRANQIVGGNYPYARPFLSAIASDEPVAQEVAAPEDPGVGVDL